jgi:hypothetical protein
MTYLRLDKTPNLGVHQTGSSSGDVNAAALHRLDQRTESRRHRKTE